MLDGLQVRGARSSSRGAGSARRFDSRVELITNELFAKPSCAIDVPTCTASAARACEMHRERVFPSRPASSFALKQATKRGVRVRTLVADRPGCGQARDELPVGPVARGRRGHPRLRRTHAAHEDVPYSTSGSPWLEVTISTGSRALGARRCFVETTQLRFWHNDRNRSRSRRRLAAVDGGM